MIYKPYATRFFTVKCTVKKPAVYRFIPLFLHLILKIFVVATISD